MSFLIHFSGLLLNIGFALYALEVWRGKVQPSLVTWFFWTLAPLSASLIYFKEEQIQGAMTTFWLGIGPLLVLASALKHRQSLPAFTKLERFCFFLSICLYLSWLGFRENTLALILALVLDIFATIPTIVKSYTHPEKESIWPYSLGLLHGIVGLVTLSTWLSLEALFPMYILCLDISMIWLLRPTRTR